MYLHFQMQEPPLQGEMMAKLVCYCLCRKCAAGLHRLCRNCRGGKN